MSPVPKPAQLPQIVLHSFARSCHQHLRSLGINRLFLLVIPGPGLESSPCSVQRHILAVPASLPEPESSSLLGSRHGIIIGNVNYDFAKDRFSPQMGIFYISFYQEKKKVKSQPFPAKSTSAKSSNNRAQTCCFSKETTWYRDKT